ncbi:substrate-binding domain-containing protein [Cohnella zeiphila]|uniref:Substrate-binding domain-containing protein n=1 Tax=Cohnella zeiphila TaxID=2761120 RepID=A0A7X0SI11_9BACL|nr:substrate-binding domain-containing protein [Cohnella zeiphila]MBB6730241.1 substrate-binding domain-containing protein [Cohnella zeiphila]
MRVHRFTAGIALLLAAAVLFAVFYFKLFTVGSSGVKTIVVVLKSTNVRADFWQTVAGGAEAAAKEAGARLETVGPLKDTDAATQALQLEEALESKPDAIVAAPINDERVMGFLKRIQEAGIELVVLDTPLALSPQPAEVAGNHREAGRQAGRLAAEETDGKPMAAVLGDYAASTVSSEREAGIREAVGQDGFAGTFYVEDSEEKAYDATRSLLAAEPRINAIAALTEPAVLGSAKALKELRRTGDVKLIAFDSTLYEIRLLEEGSLDAMIVQRPFNIGYLGVKNALKQLGGSRVDKSSLIDTIVVTKINMYSPENQKLLFPFR